MLRVRPLSWNQVRIIIRDIIDKEMGRTKLIETYRGRITDRIKLIVFQTYFDKGYSTARAMAEYFKIPVTSAHYWIQEIKNDLKQLRDEN